MVRFQRVRRRAVPPRLHQFLVGDNVYVAMKRIHSLDVTSTTLGVRADWPDGVLELARADSTVVRTCVESCAPNHIPHVFIDAVGVPANLACASCSNPIIVNPMLLYDRCDHGYHMDCLAPPLE